jgi:hypothetical protein
MLLFQPRSELTRKSSPIAPVMPWSMERRENQIPAVQGMIVYRNTGGWVPKPSYCLDG